MNKKIIVWDLFGGGVNSAYNALKNDKGIELLTFDLYPEKAHKNQYIIDLSQDFSKLKDFFDVLPKPDIIIASPLCQSFSSILQMKGGGTCFWKYEDESKTKLKERSIEEFESLKGGFTRNLKAEQQLFIKRLGEKCINNTIDLIKTYKPKNFYIENPKSSLIWKYIKYNRGDFYNDNMTFNKCYYSYYGYNQPKPTIFLSNKNLNLVYENNLKTIKDDKYKVYIDKNSNKTITKMLKGDRLNPKNRTNKFKSEGNFQGAEAGDVSHIPAKLMKKIFKTLKDSF